MDKMIVDGYKFASSRDTKLAIKEKNAIGKLQESIDINNTESVYETYNKLVSKNYFTTPVGLAFLKEMRDYLKQYYSEDELKPINVIDRTPRNDNNGHMELNYRQFEKLKQENESLNNIKQKLSIAIVAMLVVIVGMVFIVITNDNLGYFNAEEKVLNKYAAWEERLSGWEDELIRREAELSEQGQ